MSAGPESGRTVPLLTAGVERSFHLLVKKAPYQYVIQGYWGYIFGLVIHSAHYTHTGGT